MKKWIWIAVAIAFLVAVLTPEHREGGHIRVIRFVMMLILQGFGWLIVNGIIVITKRLVDHEKKTGAIVETAKSGLEFGWNTILVILGLIFVISLVDCGGGGLEDLPNTRAR
jgi:hypothetical protein